MQKFDQHHKVIFNKLFQAVGFAQFDADFVKTHKHWFRAKSWDKNDEEKFRKWFVGYVRKAYRISKTCAEKEWMSFNLQFGWKLKE